MTTQRRPIPEDGPVHADERTRILAAPVKSRDGFVVGERTGQQSNQQTTSGSRFGSGYGLCSASWGSHS